MKHKKTLLCSLLLISCLILVTSMPVFAAELTEAEVQQAVDAQGKETVTGNVFIWFLCAIAFLKVSQKIDSFMASLGVNVGNTGGNMMAELLIAGRGLASSFRGHGGGSHSSSHSSSPGSAAVQSSFLSGGLAGAVGRQTERSAVNAATGYTEGPSIGNALYQSSLEKGGDFANNVISNIAQGNYGQVGSIKGDGAVSAFQSYMGIQNEDKTDHSYTNVEIGGGRITGVESGSNGDSREFAMYHADQYTAPTQGTYETVQSVDGATWYKQYAENTVSKIPYDAGDGKIATTNPLSKSFLLLLQEGSDLVMDTERSGLDEAMDVGSSTVSHLKSLKTAATFSKAGYGAALGGPFTAAIGAVIANRNQLAKILLVILAILLLPVLFIVMLPGLIFGSLTEQSDVLNSNSMISETSVLPVKPSLKC